MSENGVDHIGPVCPGVCLAYDELATVEVKGKPPSHQPTRQHQVFNHTHPHAHPKNLSLSLQKKGNPLLFIFIFTDSFLPSSRAHSFTQRSCQPTKLQKYQLSLPCPCHALPYSDSKPGQTQKVENSVFKAKPVASLPSSSQCFVF